MEKFAEKINQQKEMFSGKINEEVDKFSEKYQEQMGKFNEQMEKFNEKMAGNFEKLGTGFKKGLTEGYYRFLTVANLAVNKMARPATESAFTFIEKNIKVEEEKVSDDTTGNWKKSLKEGIIKGREIAVKPLEYLGGLIKTSENEFATQLREEYGIDTNQWIFSKENLEMLEKINLLADITFAEVRHISNYTSMRYLTAWTILQKLYRKVHGIQAEVQRMQAHEGVDDISVAELKLIKDECFHFAIYAPATYGDIMNFVYSGKDVSKIIGFVDYTKQFLFYTKLQEEDIFHSFWDATPYRPAYVIARDEKTKSIVLCMRGSNNWADFATDLDFHYLSLSIARDTDTKEFFLRFNFDEHTQVNFKERIGDTTRIFNGHSSNGSQYKESILETGFTHAGMMVSAIEVYKEITPKLEEILSKPEYADYNLVITGHSLGGGMSTLMAFLYLIHPLKALKGNVMQRMKAYSFGGACVLSKDFDMYLKDIMKCVIFWNDVVPRLSYGSIKDICKIILMFEQLQKDQPQLFKEILDLDAGEEFEHIKDEDIAKIQKEIELYQIFKSELSNSIKLNPMGRTFFIEGIKSKDKETQKESQFTMREIKDKELFEEIIFSRELVKHHFPHVYEEGLSSEQVIYKVD